MENTKNARVLARKFVYQYLLTHPCTSCGETDPTVLEFHHGGEKDKEVGRMIAQGYGVEALAAEISQCIVLCANCHRRLTAKENNWYKGK
jgi:5-methylcytosine-specific restriction endonuclease McrA